MYSPPMYTHVQRQQPPELLRVPLEGVVLTVKATFGDGAGADATLCRALTPPAQAAVAAAVANLKVGRAEEQRLCMASALRGQLRPADACSRGVGWCRRLLCSRLL